MITIGVSGHRFLTETGKLGKAVDEALCHIEASFGESSFRVVSALAEGADRLVVERVLARRGAKLTALLPLPKHEYLSDFGSAASKDEFLRLLERADQVRTLPPATSREEAYLAAGIYLLDHCDVLVAVWDGQQAQGTGGTGEIVQEARRRGMPLAWILAGNRIPGTSTPTTLGVDQGKVRLEHFPS